MRLSFVQLGLRRTAPALALPLLHGCLIGPPTELTEEEPAPPRALVELAVPSTLSTFQTSATGDATPFQVTVEAEDLGELLVGRLYLNFGSETGRLLAGTAEAPVSNDPSGRREVKVPWSDQRNVPAGCYSMTLAVTYNDNYSIATVPVPIDNEKTAFVTWWLIHDFAPQDLTLDECPTSTNVAP